MSETAAQAMTAESAGVTAGPILRAGEVTDAIIEALRQDNEGKELMIADHGGYIRVEAIGGLVLNRATAEYMLGRPFMMQELEIYMTGFSGKIYTTSDQVRWFFKKIN